MERFKKMLLKIFFLPPIPTLLAAVFGFGFVIAVAAFKIKIPALQYLSYISSAYALTVSVTAFPRFIRFTGSLKKRVSEYSLIKKIGCTTLGKRFFSDVRFRTEVNLYVSLFINFLYIAIKLFSGIYYRSVWFIALAVYYILLAVMRFILLHKNKKTVMTMQTEFKRYRMCGIMLLLMNQALAGIVIFMVHQNKGFDYPGVLIYAMAMYSFYSIITAVMNLVKFRRHGSPLLSAAKVINLVAAMVSILSLETAMLARFGGNDDFEFRRLMTELTGGGVCTIVIAVAAFMLWTSSRQLKNPEITDTKGDTENEQQ